MGDYLRLAYKLRDINRFIDGDYEKLSDKYHELELSHNRKKKALEKILKYCYAWQPVVPPEFLHVVDICKSALFCDGRCNCRPIVQRNKKGGAK